MAAEGLVVDQWPRYFNQTQHYKNSTARWSAVGFQGWIACDCNHILDYVDQHKDCAFVRFDIVDPPYPDDLADSAERRTTERAAWASLGEVAQRSRKRNVQQGWLRVLENLLERMRGANARCSIMPRSVHRSAAKRSSSRAV
jgi:hypothetical protein